MMGAAGKIFSYLLRWHRSRGFGVHSPFAFHFITGILREEAQYYAYTDIDKATVGRERSDRRDLKAIFRAVCHLQPAKVVFVGQPDNALRVAVERAVPQADMQVMTPLGNADGECPQPLAQFQGEKGRRFAVVVESLSGFSADDEKQILELMADESRRKGAEGVLIIRHLHRSDSLKSFWSRLVSGMPAGMTFSNSRIGIYCLLRSLPRQHFDVIF